MRRHNLFLTNAYFSLLPHSSIRNVKVQPWVKNHFGKQLISKPASPNIVLKVEYNISWVQNKGQKSLLNCPKVPKRPQKALK